MRGHDVSETELSDVDVCTVICDLNGYCLLTIYVETVAVELLYYVIVKEED